MTVQINVKFKTVPAHKESVIPEREVTFMRHLQKPQVSYVTARNIHRCAGIRGSLN